MLGRIVLVVLPFMVVVGCEEYDEKTWCEKCGEVRWTRGSRSVFGDSEHIVELIPKGYSTQFLEGKHDHQWVKPPLPVFAGEGEADAKTTRRGQKLSDLELIHKKGQGDFRGPYVDAMLSLGKQQSTQIWRDFISPERGLAVGLLEVFTWEMSPEAKWEVWQAITGAWKCRDEGARIVCGLSKPEWRPWETFSPGGAYQSRPTDLRAWCEEMNVEACRAAKGPDQPN